MDEIIAHLRTEILVKLAEQKLSPIQTEAGNMLFMIAGEEFLLEIRKVIPLNVGM